jgi:hypothetical protein
MAGLVITRGKKATTIAIDRERGPVADGRLISAPFERLVPDDFLMRSEGGIPDVTPKFGRHSTPATLARYMPTFW